MDAQSMFQLEIPPGCQPFFRICEKKVVFGCGKCLCFKASSLRLVAPDSPDVVHAYL